MIDAIMLLMRCEWMHVLHLLPIWDGVVLGDRLSLASERVDTCFATYLEPTCVRKRMTSDEQ